MPAARGGPERKADDPAESHAALLLLGDPQPEREVVDAEVLSLQMDGGVLPAEEGVRQQDGEAPAQPLSEGKAAELAAPLLQQRQRARQDRLGAGGGKLYEDEKPKKKCGLATTLPRNNTATRKDLSHDPKALTP